MSRSAARTRLRTLWGLVVVGLVTLILPANASVPCGQEGARAVGTGGRIAVPALHTDCRAARSGPEGPGFVAQWRSGPYTATGCEGNCSSCGCVELK
jgi:hypothetical protein